MFVYSQLQNIHPDSALGSISNWDKFLHLGLDDATLPFKTAAEFILNEDFHQLVVASKLPRPSKFVEQSMSFCKAFCKDLLNHELVKSDLVRGSSSFEPVVIYDGMEEHYLSAVEKLTSHFTSIRWIISSDKVKAVSQYRSFVTKLRSVARPEWDDWTQHLSGHYEMHCRPQLCALFKFSCLCVPSTLTLPPVSEVSLPFLDSDHAMFRSCVRCLQLPYMTIPNVSRLYRDTRTIQRVFRLLGRGPELLANKKFQIWNFL